MHRRLSNWISTRATAAAIMLLAASAAARSAQASCGDYLQGPQMSRQSFPDSHSAPVPHGPHREHGCRDGSCRPSLPAPVSETNVWDLLKHAACVAGAVQEDAHAHRSRPSADLRSASGPDQARLFRPPRSA
jgi:hypothetical protein